MNTTNHIQNTKTAWVIPARFASFAFAACIGIGHIPAAYAAGTLAGTDITNTATATYDTPTGPVTLDSNTVIINVDELLDVTIIGTQRDKQCSDVPHYQYRQWQRGIRPDG
jgi:hypothetical protein